MGVRRWVALRALASLCLLAVLITSASVGNAAFALLIDRHPLAIVALNPAGRYLLIVSEKVDLVAFVIVATLRRYANALVFYSVGKWHGATVLQWSSRKSRSVNWATQVLARRSIYLSSLAVLVAPGRVVSLAVGCAGMSKLRFATLSLIGVSAYVCVVRLLASMAVEPLAATRAAIGGAEYWVTGVAVLVTMGWLGVVAQSARRSTGIEAIPRSSPIGAPPT